MEALFLVEMDESATDNATDNATDEAGTRERQRRLEVTVVGALQMPLMVGRDAFCHIDFAGSEFATKAKPAGGSLEWGDVFTFEFEKAGMQSPGPLRITMLSWETYGGSKRIGSACISAENMRSVTRTALGWQKEAALRLTENGRVVIGQDGRATEVVLRLAVLAAVHGFSSFMRVELRLRLDHERGARATHPGQADVDRFTADVLTDVATALCVDPAALRVAEVRGRLTCSGAGAGRRLAGRPILMLDVSSDARNRNGLGSYEIAHEIVRQANDRSSSLQRGKYTGRVASAAVRGAG
jgi:hypothetical protein